MDNSILFKKIKMIVFFCVSEMSKINYQATFKIFLLSINILEKNSHHTGSGFQQRRTMASPKIILGRRIFARDARNNVQCCWLKAKRRQKEKNYLTAR